MPYNPYYNPYQQPMYQPPMQDRLSQLQNQYQATVPQPVYQPVHLNGQMVDSIDVVKAKDVDMSGAVTYYPKADLSEIYTKQLQADGTSRIVTYRAVPQETPIQEPQAVTMDTLNALIGQLRTDVLSEIGGIKEMVGNLSVAEEKPATRTAKGAAKS